MQVAYKKILQSLEKQNIFHIHENELSPEQEKELKDYFNLKLKHLTEEELTNTTINPSF